MIPHRMLSNEVYGSGLKDRVIACRKRLRVNRVIHRTLVHDEVEELFPETSPSVRVEGQASFSLSETEDGAQILLVGERGVGIT